jgi:hypothetical protein
LEGPEVGEVVAGGVIDHVNTVSLTEDVVGVRNCKISRWGLGIAEPCETGDKK